MLVNNGGNDNNIRSKPAAKPKQGTATKENRGLSAAKLNKSALSLLNQSRYKSIPSFITRH